MARFSVKIPGVRLRPRFRPDAVPLAVRDHPSMMSIAEKSLLYRVARHAYTAEGSIIDAGVFMGASTVAFASGLRKNRATRRYRHGKPIQSYDAALWAKGMDKPLSADFTEILARWNLKAGQSFEPLLRSLISGNDDLVELHVGDIIETARTAVPVEVAFYDCLKDTRRDKAVFKAFAPHYIAGKTIVIQQDYFFDGAPDHRIRQEFLAPYFTYLGNAKSSGVFKVSSPIPPAYFRDDPVERLDVATKIELLEQAARRPSSLHLSLLTRLSTVRLALQHKRWEQARELLSSIQAVMDSSDPASLGVRLPRQVKVLTDTVERRARSMKPKPR